MAPGRYNVVGQPLLRYRPEGQLRVRLSILCKEFLLSVAFTCLLVVREKNCADRAYVGVHKRTDHCRLLLYRRAQAAESVTSRPLSC